MHRHRHARPRAKERIGPNFGEQLVRQNLVQSSLLSFPIGIRKIALHDKSSGDSSPAKFGPILGISIHFSLSFGSKPQAKERIGRNFWEQPARQNLVQSSLLSFPIGTHKTALYDKSSGDSSPAKFGPIFGMSIHFSLSFGSKPQAKERIGRNFGEILGNSLPCKIWSNPPCCHFLSVSTK